MVFKQGGEFLSSNKELVFYRTTGFRGIGRFKSQDLICFLSGPNFYTELPTLGMQPSLKFSLHLQISLG